jgi:hypothetical protein
MFKHISFKIASKLPQKFEVTVPSALQFLEFYAKEVRIEREDDHMYLSQYLIEATLLDPK